MLFNKEVLITGKVLISQSATEHFFNGKKKGIIMKCAKDLFRTSTQLKVYIEYLPLFLKQVSEETEAKQIQCQAEDQTVQV